MICKKCDKDKDESEFSWKIKAKGIRQSACKTCMADYERWYRESRKEFLAAQNKVRYQENREQNLANKSDYYRRNIDKLKARSKANYAKNREKRLASARVYALKSRFGLTPEQYDLMFAAQGGVCAICHRPSDKGTLVVDHCHKTGKIRGLLCRVCNSFLGRIDDSLEALDAIKEYLQKPDQTPPLPPGEEPVQLDLLP